jgi:hypothetical protein
MGLKTSNASMQLKTFLHSGSLGDVIYSLPTIQALGGGRLYIKRALFHDGYDQFDALHRLLIHQPYITEVLPYPAQYAQFEYDPDIHIDYDLDKARLQQNRGRIHIIKRHLDAMGAHKKNWQLPWLTVPDIDIKYPYYLIQLTPRYRLNSRVNWRHILEQLAGHAVYFVGFPEEWATFCRQWGSIPKLPVRDLWEFALAVKGCEAFLSNQSVGLVIAQAIGKKYYLERHPHRTNCLLYTPNENIL